MHLQSISIRYFGSIMYHAAVQRPVPFRWLGWTLYSIVLIKVPTMVHTLPSTTRQLGVHASWRSVIQDDGVMVGSMCVTPCPWLAWRYLSWMVLVF